MLPVQNENVSCSKAPVVLFRLSFISSLISSYNRTNCSINFLERHSSIPFPPCSVTFQCALVIHPFAFLPRFPPKHYFVAFRNSRSSPRIRLARETQLTSPFTRLLKYRFHARTLAAFNLLLSSTAALFFHHAVSR